MNKFQTTLSVAKLPIKKIFLYFRHTINDMLWTR